MRILIQDPEYFDSNILCDGVMNIDHIREAKQNNWTEYVRVETRERTLDIIKHLILTEQ